ncbi:MAG: hypothetical protein RMK45_02805 [Armatimonadota bacterium]|nr:hypothetical protein [Armatimonadota bacterium]
MDTGSPAQWIGTEGAAKGGNRTLGVVQPDLLGVRGIRKYPLAYAIFNP